MTYFYFKSLHLIFMVCWFSGLFYLVRLFIYFKEAENKDNNTKKILQDQFTLMTKRLLYFITWPAAFLTTFFGLVMIYINPFLLDASWMQVKLCFIFLLWLYTYSCQYFYNQMVIGKITINENRLRIWNELATIFLFTIIFIAILQNSISWLFISLGLIIITIILMFLIKIYKRYMLDKKD